MAKELPFFRFTASEWLQGDISLESYELKGLFTDVCAYYWSEDCILTLAKLQKKFSNATHLLQQLIDCGVIKHENRHDKINIYFLLSQYDLLSDKRKRRQEAGSKGGNAKAKLKQKDSYKYKDKYKDKDKDNIIVKFSFENALKELGADQQLITDWLLVRKNKKATNSETAFNLLKNEFTISGLPINEILKICIVGSWSGFKTEWLKNISIPETTGTKFQHILTSINTAHDYIKAKHGANSTGE